MIYIVGGTGFVGSAYVRLCQQRGLPHRLVTRDNLAELARTACDLLIDANGTSTKRMAEADPLEDFDRSVRVVAERIAKLKARRYLFLSTGDVYPDQTSPAVTREDAPLQVARMSRYGLHRYLSERLVIGAQSEWLTIRMGGFVGPGIKKNAVFDMLTGGTVWLAPDSALQFINTDHAAELVMGLVDAGVSHEIVNLGGSGLAGIGEVHKAVGSRSPFNPGSPLIRYELDLAKLTRLAGRAPRGSLEQVLEFAKGWPESGAA